MARGKTSTKANIIIGQPIISWKRRPSEIRGYHRALYLTSDDGDYLRVDYNLKEKRVRLYVEIASEGGSSYYSVISNGRITAEKSVQSGRSFSFADRFKARADIFSTIPNKEIIRLINKNYTIGKKDERVKKERQKEIEETKRRYFKRDEETGEYIDGEYGGETAGHYGFVDIIDVLIGFILSGLIFYLFQFSFIAMGAVSAFFGIIIGFVDMFIRGRSPVFLKVIFFVAIGTVAYIYGYFIL